MSLVSYVIYVWGATCKPILTFVIVFCIVQGDFVVVQKYPGTCVWIGRDLGAVAWWQALHMVLHDADHMCGGMEGMEQKEVP